MRVIPRLVRVRTALALLLGVGAALSPLGCSVLLDWDLSGEAGGDGAPDERTGNEAATSETSTSGDGADPRDGGEDAPTDGSTDGPFVLDCADAQLCDDFENRTVPFGVPRAGAWNGNEIMTGTADIVSDSVAHGARSLLIDVPTSTVAAPMNAFMGAKNLAFGTTRTVTASFEVKLEYDPAAYTDATWYHVVVDINPEGAGGADYETAGLYYRKNDGVYLVLRTYDSSGAALPSPIVKPLGVDLRGAFHHMLFEVVYSTSTTGGSARVVVDNGTPIVTPKARTLRAAVPTYVATFGATPGPMAPQMKARFDDIVLRTR